MHFGCSLELMTKLDDIEIPLEIDSNMILIVLCLTSLNSVYQRNHEWLVIGGVLIPWVLIMLWLKVKSNTDWTNIYNCILLIGARWEKCSFCRGCMSKMNVSCAEQIIKAIWEQFCQAKETNSKKYQIILSLEFLHYYSFDLYEKPCLPWDTQTFLTSVKGIKFPKKVHCNAVISHWHCVFTLTIWPTAYKGL